MLRDHRLVARRFIAGFVVLAAAILTSASAVAENIKIGIIKNVGSGPLFIALERGYFIAEGVPAELI